MDGEGYERWVAGYDVETGAAKGRLRTDEQGLRFVEVVVNGPKTWSLAASLHPDIADAYDAAQEQAVREIIGWLAGHATTRVGPRGRQVQVPVDRLELRSARLAKLRRALDAGGFDAIIVSAAENVLYATGYESIPSFLNPRTEAAAIVTSDRLLLVVAAAAQRHDRGHDAGDEHDGQDDRDDQRLLAALGLADPPVLELAFEMTALGVAALLVRRHGAGVYESRLENG